MKTYYGTFTDINESDIFAIYGELKFYFTSNYIKKKFIENIDYYVNLEELKVINKYQISIELKEYLSIWYYKKIQKKGYRIENIKTNKKITELNYYAINKE